MLEKKDIVKGLQRLGLGQGDIVLLHSALSSLGQVENGAPAVVQAFLDTIGPEGTLAVPVFGRLGIITETVKNWPGAVTSIHPLACIAAVGASAREICADHWRAETAHGKGTPYTKIADLGGYVCLLGVDQDRNTTLHTVETLLELPYLNDKTAVAETPEGPVEKTWRFFPGPHRDFIGLEQSMRKSGLIKIGRIGNAMVRLMKSREMIDHCLAVGRQDPAFVLCDNPSCPDCQWQRGRLKKAGFQSENFVLAAASSLAGEYVPEIIENLIPSGITRLELDRLQGQPIEKIPLMQLRSAVEQLREAEVEIISLRACVRGREENLNLLEKAVSSDVRRLVVPLHADCEELLTKAADAGVRISLYNHRISSRAAADLLLELSSKGFQPGFTFNPGNFAASAEKPFLVSFKTKVKKFIDQLDVCDRAFNGRETELAGGNAEIKELISILRCSCFSGYMVLGGGSENDNTLLKTADRMLSLLDSM